MHDDIPMMEAPDPSELLSILDAQCNFLNTDEQDAVDAFFASMSRCKTDVGKNESLMSHLKFFMIIFWLITVFFFFFFQ